jgi:DNA/RNA-binding domain of Phe-tRNA-synthetase-like protein
MYPEYCVGVVVIRHIDNTRSVPEGILAGAMDRARQLLGPSPREHPGVKMWRDAFQKVGYNPNKYPPSIDALASRVARGGRLPSINAAVDIINAHSLTYILPMGAHDVSRLSGDLQVRRAGPGEVFTPMGGGQAELVNEGEIVYADDCQVRTRRWIWRQGDLAKVTPETTHLFCPIDGFTDINLQAVLAARQSLAAMLLETVGGEVCTWLVDKHTPVVPIA